MSESLANQLQRLCCAETEGKFFDCVTDNIDAILKALRSSGVAQGWKVPDVEQALILLLAAAKLMPRATPAPGGASTVHNFPIEAAYVWALDRACQAAEKALALPSTDREGGK